MWRYVEEDFWNGNQNLWFNRNNATIFVRFSQYSELRCDKNPRKIFETVIEISVFRRSVHFEE